MFSLQIKYSFSSWAFYTITGYLNKAKEPSQLYYLTKTCRRREGSLPLPSTLCEVKSRNIRQAFELVSLFLRRNIIAE